MSNTETFNKFEIDGDNLVEIAIEVTFLPQHDEGQTDPPPAERELSRRTFTPKDITEEMVRTVVEVDLTDGPDFEIKPFGAVYEHGLKTIRRWLKANLDVIDKKARRKGADNWTRVEEWGGVRKRLVIHEAFDRF